MKKLEGHLPLLLLVVLSAIGLALRLHFARPEIYPSVDGVFYLEQCRALVLHHRLPFSSFGPGWPLIASVPLFFFDPTDSLQVFRAAQGVNVVLGVLWLALTYFLLRRNLGPWLALVGAAVLIALPPALIASKGVLSETSYGCLLVAAFLLLPRRRFLAGFALGYAYLIRPEALLVIVGVTVWLGWRDRRIPWGAVAGAALCVIPYLVFIHHNTGTWSLTGKMEFLEEAWRRNEGGAFIPLLIRNLYSILQMLPGQLGIPVVLLALIGVWRRPSAPYLAFMALLPLPLFDFAMVDRYWLPYLPFVLLAAGSGAIVLARAVTFLPRKVSAVMLFVLVMGGVVLASGDEARWVSRHPNRYEGLLDAGLWLKPHVGENTKIAAYKPYASFWAGCRFVKYPAGKGIRDLLDTLEEEGVDFLVVNAHVAKVFVPSLKVLLGPQVEPDLKNRVEPLKIFDYSLPDQFTVVFRLASSESAAP